MNHSHRNKPKIYPELWCVGYMATLSLYMLWTYYLGQVWPVEGLLSGQVWPVEGLLSGPSLLLKRLCAPKHYKIVVSAHFIEVQLRVIIWAKFIIVMLHKLRPDNNPYLAQLKVVSCLFLLQCWQLFLQWLLNIKICLPKLSKTIIFHIFSNTGERQTIVATHKFTPKTCLLSCHSLIKKLSCC